MLIVCEVEYMKAQILEKKGEKEFVVLTCEDYDDLKELRKAKKESKGQKPIPFDQAVRCLGLEK